MAATLAAEACCSTVSSADGVTSLLYQELVRNAYLDADRRLPGVLSVVVYDGDLASKSALTVGT